MAASGCQWGAIFDPVLVPLQLQDAMCSNYHTCCTESTASGASKQGVISKSQQTLKSSCCEDSVNTLLSLSI